MTTSGPIHDWSTAGPHADPAPRPVQVQDETLREGMQSPSIHAPALEARVQLLHYMAALGVDSVSLGIPVTGAVPRQVATRLLQEIQRADLPLQPNCGGRTMLEDVRAIADVVQQTGVSCDAALFLGSSPLRQLAEDWDLEQMVRFTQEAVGLGVREGLAVMFITEDTTRSNPEHLEALFHAALDAGASRLCLCDTVGSATPASTRNLVEWTRDFLVRRESDAAIDWHGHQDRGLALANVLAAIHAGADRVHATALGLGERVGNAPMEQVLVNLRLLGFRQQDLSALPAYVALVAASAGVVIPPATPLVGEDAFVTATGVHAAAIVKALEKGQAELSDLVYSAIPPTWLGRKARIQVGPMSGAANVRHVLEGRGVHADASMIRKVLDLARQRGRVLTDEDLDGCLSDAEEPQAGSYFISTYPPFSCWQEEGAQAWREALDRPRDPQRREALGLYVHVPFCVERCRYCYYLSYDERAGDMERYVQALTRETQAMGRMPALQGRRPDFVYFGGGTPSLLSHSRLEEVLASVREGFSWEDTQEVTFECAPRSVTQRKLELLREAGVTRISMGVQAMDDEVLAQNGRVHQVSDVRAACEAVRAVDFPVLNLDLIVGLVGETRESFLRSLEALLALEPDSVTLYQLEIPLNTPLYQDLEEGSLQEEPADWTEKRARLDQAFTYLEAQGYTLRSAYTAVRDPERHTFHYQDQQYQGADVIGLGTSSFSYLDGIHHQNRASLRQYLEAVEDGRLPLWRGHVLSAEEQRIREFILQLKLGRVDVAAFQQRHGVDPRERFAAGLAPLVERGLARTSATEVALTRAGLLRADRLLPAFYRPEHQGVRYS